MGCAPSSMVALQDVAKQKAEAAKDEEETAACSRPPTGNADEATDPPGAEESGSLRRAQISRLSPEQAAHLIGNPYRRALLLRV